MHTCLTWKIAANLSLSRRAQSRGFDPLTATYFTILQIKNNEGATPSTGIRRRSVQDVLLLSDTVRIQGWRGRNKTFVVSVFSPSIIRAPSTSLAGGRLHSKPERRLSLSIGHVRDSSSTCEVGVLCLGNETQPALPTML